jgi:Na+-driven multidrug efflux pump
MINAFVWGLPLIGANITLMVSFQALGKPVQAMFIGLGRALLFYIPMLYLLNHILGFNGFIWARPVADILTTLIALVLSRPLFRLMRT